ncbi:MAG TPA: alpha/beta hydrolase [Baekduia sp.]|nr:alpha/beta hydrolase [Baekduia sp.]
MTTVIEDLLGTRLRRAPAPADPAGPPLVLLSAWPQTLRSWDAHWAALAARHELVAVELPGFGRAPLAARAEMRPSAQAAALARLLDALGLPAAVVVAPDVGVPVALRLAQDRPDRVAGLVVFDGPASFPPRFSWEGRLLARSRTARALTAAAGIPFVLEIVRRGYRRRRPPLAVVLDHLRSAASPRRFGRQLAFVGSYAEELPALQARLRDVRVPVLVTWGTEDEFVLPEEGRALAAALPQATWEPLEGCGHYAHEDAGPAFTALVERWWSAVAPAAPLAA